MRCNRGLLACLALGLLSIPATSAPAPKKPKGHATPQACFAAAMTAMTREDYKVFFPCLTDDAQDYVTGQMLVIAASMKGPGLPGGADTIKAVDRLLSKHKISPNVVEQARKNAKDLLNPRRDENRKALKELVRHVKDKAGFAVDVHGVMPKEDGVTSKSKPVSLKDVKITGGKATGRIAIKKPEGEDPGIEVTFSKDKAGWRMNLPYRRVAK